MFPTVGVVLIALVGAACAVALFVDVRNRELSAIKEIFETASSDRTKALSVRALSVVKSAGCFLALCSVLLRSLHENSPLLV